MDLVIRKMKATDARRGFRSGTEALDEYFHRYASKNQYKLFIGVTWVAVTTDDTETLGYVTLSPGQANADDLPSGRPFPRYPIPVLRIARLAVAEGAQGRGIGSLLLAHAVSKGLALRDEFGCAAIVTDAKPPAVAFYERHDFVVIQKPTRPEGTTLMAFGLWMTVGP